MKEIIEEYKGRKLYSYHVDEYGIACGVIKYYDKNDICYAECTFKPSYIHEMKWHGIYKKYNLKIIFLLATQKNNWPFGIEIHFNYA